MIALSKSITYITDIDYYPITLWCDSQSAKACVEATGGTKLRHMTEILEDYVKECVERKLVYVVWIESKDQIADIFTKSLPFEKHETLTKKIMNYDLCFKNERRGNES